jgi:hypothetical protein
MQISFDFSQQKITIEGDELELVEVLKLAREIAPKLPTINIVSVTSPASPAPPKPPSNGDNNKLKTMRQFVRSIELSNISERICAIAYYQKVIASPSRPTLSPKEMGDLFVQCGLQQPGNMPVAMFDAKRKYGFMESASHGQWRISTQGENLIIGRMEDKTEQDASTN